MEDLNCGNRNMRRYFRNHINRILFLVTALILTLSQVCMAQAAQTDQEKKMKEQWVQTALARELLAGYDKILKSAGLDAETVFDGVYVFDAKSGARAAVAVFGSADTLTDCKYIGIVASKDGKVRYFTAENDIMQADIWYFCEVTKDYRGTISSFKKTDDDTDVPLFVNYCQKAFDEDIYASSKLERKLEQ